MRTDYFDHLIPAGPTRPTTTKESGVGENVEIARVTPQAPPTPHENAESEKTAAGKSNRASNRDRTGRVLFTNYGAGHPDAKPPEPMPAPAVGWPTDLLVLLNRVATHFEWTSADRQAFIAWARSSPEGLADARRFLEAEAAKLPVPGPTDRPRVALDR